MSSVDPGTIDGTVDERMPGNRKFFTPTTAANQGTFTARDWVLPSADYTIMGELLAGDVAVIEEELKVAQRVLMPQKPSVDQHADPESPSGPESA